VGTSSNGAGAFGASINFSTNEINKDAYLEINNSGGSFNTWKNTIKAGSGLVNGFSTDIRLSNISSDGFIDRAFSKLKSVYFSQAYIRGNTSLRLNIFSGKEKTYQAWYGISEADLKTGNRTVNYAGTEKPGTPYDNETDNYTQTHYQLFFNQQIKNYLHLNVTFFLTKGNGYYEQYKAGNDYATYHLPYPIHGSDTILTSDFIRQLWLDNSFYGNIISLQYKKHKNEVTMGGSYSKYDGLHFGKVIWASNGLTGLDTWYHLDAFKKDLNVFCKHEVGITNNLQLFYDLQYRTVQYDINGFRDNPTLIVNKGYHFFNPKFGISYNKKDWKSYFSYSIANKEPNRDDFEAGALQQPAPERLRDVELGVERKTQKYSWSAALYYMDYKNQLVLTGKINDVGAYTRTNIPDSYRAGLELTGTLRFNKWLNTTGNFTFSRNRVRHFSEYIDDYDNGGQKIRTYHVTNLAFSPSVISGIVINFQPLKNLELSLLNKYVSKQYLDNTQNENRILNAFQVHDVRAIYKIYSKKIKEITITGQIFNILNCKYEPNGYTYSYILNSNLVTENYYFPMAGINFLAGISMKL
jgi:iron complex outermembrane receptor protein